MPGRLLPHDEVPVLNQDILGVQSVRSSGENFETNKYSLEAVRRDIHYKAEKIRSWAVGQGLKEGEDYLIVEDVRTALKPGDEPLPHEIKSFAMAILEKDYRRFRDYFTGQYAQERKAEDPKSGPQLDYSWGGRFSVGWDGLPPLDTVPAVDLKNLTIRSHHQKFRQFFRQQTGFELPTAAELNPLLKDMAKQALPLYEATLNQLKSMASENKLPSDGYGLIDELERMKLILTDAHSGDALVDLAETIGRDGMTPEMRHYADLTYNAEDLKSLDRATELTGIEIPDFDRIDKLYDRYGFDRAKMENICRAFGEYLESKQGSNS